MGRDEPTEGREFNIELMEVERESMPFEDEHYKVGFECERDGNSFIVAVWIKVGAVPTVDLLRTAMHELHLVLKRLAVQTEAWRIDTR